MNLHDLLMLLIAISGGALIGLVIAAAIIDHSTYVASCRARATVGRRR